MTKQRATMTSPNKISLKIVEKLKTPWLLCSTSNAELKIVKDVNRKLANVDAAQSTIILFRPQTLEMSSCQYLQSEMVTHLPVNFPTKAIKQEDIEMMKKDFMKEFRDANLLSLKTSDQHVVFIVIKMFPAKQVKYGFRVPMKIADQDGNIGMMNIFKDASRFEEGGIYRVTGLQRRNPDADVAQFRTTGKTEVLELSEEDASDITFPKLGEKEMKGQLLLTYGVSNTEVCREHRHPAATCAFCQKFPQWMTPSTWEMSATGLIQLTTNHGYAEERKIYLDGPSLFGCKPGKILSFIEGIHNAATRKEGKTVKIQFDTVKGQAYARKLEIIEDEDEDF